MDAGVVTELVAGIVTGVVIGWHRATASAETRVRNLGQNLGPRVDGLVAKVAYIQGKLGIPLDAAPAPGGTIEGSPDGRPGR